MDKDAKYMEHIAPLMDQIGLLCREHDICMIASFSTGAAFYGSFFAGPQAPAPSTYVGSAISLGIISPNDIIRDALNLLRPSDEASDSDSDSDDEPLVLKRH